MGDTSTDATAVRRRYVPAEEPASPLTARNLEALRLVAENRFLATRHVADAMGISRRAAREHLRVAFDHGLTTKLPVANTAVEGSGSPAGSWDDAHYPTAEGLRRLRKLGLLPRSAGRPREPGYGSLPHEILVRDMLGWLCRSARRHAAAGHLLERWSCAAGLAAGNARPDAVFAYRFEPGEEGRAVAAFLEADTGSERGAGGEQDRWAQKAAAYAALFAEPGRACLIAAVGAPRARVAVTVPDRPRAARLAHRLAETGIAPYLWVAAREDLEAAEDGTLAPVWLRPGGDVLPFVAPGG